MSVQSWFDTDLNALSQKALLKRLQEIQFALDKSVVLSITDANGILQYVNEKFCVLSKFTKEELLGQPYSIVNSGYHSKAFFEELWETITHGDIWEGEICNQAKDGSIFWLMTTIIPFKDEAGQPTQYVAIRKDITETKTVERKLQQLTVELEDRVFQRTQNLEALNEEFSGIILHYEQLFSSMQSLLNSMNPILQKDLHKTDSQKIPQHEHIRQTEKPPHVYLSEREKEVLSQLVEGKTNKEISEALCITTHTVKSHISKIMQKLDVTDRTKAAVVALKLGLIKA